MVDLNKQRENDIQLTANIKEAHEGIIEAYNQVNVIIAASIEKFNTALKDAHDAGEYVKQIRFVEHFVGYRDIPGYEINRRGYHEFNLLSSDVAYLSVGFD